MNQQQFDALAKLLKLRKGPSQQVARLVIVEMMSVPDAARFVGLEYTAAHHAVKRVERGYKLVQEVAQKISTGA